MSRNVNRRQDLPKTTAEQRHILVVDDEREMREALAEYLSLRGFRVSLADDGEALRRVMARDPAELVLLDLSLPGEDGIELTRQLKTTGGVGIIMVTAHGESEDRVLGLETGADDYVVKPFNFRELVARIRSVLRRARHEGDTSGRFAVAATLRIGELAFSRRDQTLVRADGSHIELSAGELDLLNVFADNPDRPISRDELLEASSHRDWEPFDRSIDVRVARLRRKIELNPARPTIIRTVRGTGYLLNTRSI
jgi:two-component system phosphate regulon response regulator OmpR